MFYSIVICIISLTIITQISSENLNGIYVIDSCECSSPTEKCEPKGPFILDQQRTSFAVRYGAVQVGVGTSGNNRLDLYLNKNRCKGSWNGKSRLADLKCQHENGIICSTKLRCVSGACLDDKSNIVASSSMTITTSILSLITSLLILIY
ncbi:unnamed protein product [Adineta steineri]|uniref:Uncharacterized protein n=1 Tax=Adineta steineri TaxID=433720 RepID=A0A813WCQ0_9BILA|nr:unnamed protein product [Adineta steineri]CAF1242684.1 unnamed protein product [Adineta steineri]